MTETQRPPPAPPRPRTLVLPDAAPAFGTLASVKPQPSSTEGSTAPTWASASEPLRLFRSDTLGNPLRTLANETGPPPPPTHRVQI